MNNCIVALDAPQPTQGYCSMHLSPDNMSFLHFSVGVGAFVIGPSQISFFFFSYTSRRVPFDEKKDIFVQTLNQN